MKHAQQYRSWRDSIYGEIRAMMQLEGSLNTVEACRSAQVNRPGFYWDLQAHQPRQAETELRRRIQQVAISRRSYGTRSGWWRN